MTTLCTLFDHNYLDKGIVMYESLEKVSKEFELYVLCMSDRCYEILLDLKLPHLIPIKLEDFEDEALLRVKPTRSIGEYCWTCSSSLVRYVLLTYKPDYCAYIDSDLYFYSDPKVVIEEMERKNASVQITGHRFNKDVAKERIWKVGRFCVEYNTFKNDDNGLFLVNKWRDQCIDYCSIDGDGIHWADQKYMDNWCVDYDFVIETANLGMGVAPWNIRQYELSEISGKGVLLKCENAIIPLVFYHYQGIKYLDKTHVKMGIDESEKKVLILAKALYTDYLKKVNDVKRLIESKYGLFYIMKSHPGATHHESFLKHLYSLLKAPSLLVRKYGSVRLRMLFEKDIIKLE